MIFLKMTMIQAIYFTNGSHFNIFLELSFS